MGNESCPECNQHVGRENAEGLQSQLPDSPPPPWMSSQANCTALWFFKVLEQNELLHRESAVWSRLTKTSVSQPQHLLPAVTQAVRGQSEWSQTFTFPPSSLWAHAPPSVASDPSRCPPLSETPWLSPLPSAHIQHLWSIPLGCPLRVPGLMVVVRCSWMTTHSSPQFCALLPHSPTASSFWGGLSVLGKAFSRRLWPCHLLCV